MKGLALVDLNLDGYPDAVISSGTAGQIAILINGGGTAGTFGSALTYGTPAGSSNPSISVGYLNSHGLLDIATPDKGLTMVSTFPWTAGVTNNITPSLYSGKVAWEGTDTNGDSQIYFWDGVSLDSFAITSNVTATTLEETPSLFQDTIAWVEASTAGTAIDYFDGSTIGQIAFSASGDALHPSLGADTAGNPLLAWQQGGEILYWEGAFDTSAGAPIITTLTSDGSDTAPAVSKGTIAWVHGDTEVWFWDGSNMERIASAATTGTVVSNNNGNLAWDGVAGSTTR